MSDCLLGCLFLQETSSCCFSLDPFILPSNHLSYLFVAGIDTTGCMRIPASFCGIIGFRPSHGAVSTIGILPNSQSLDTIGMLVTFLFCSFASNV